MNLPNVACLALLAALATTIQQQPVFRSSANAVQIEVSVRNGNRPVTGLTGRDFEVIDNGVPQKVELISIETVPLDVTFVLDVSREAFSHGRIREFRTDVQRLVALLDPESRFRILADGTYVSEVVAMQPATAQLSLDDALPVGGGTSTPDAIIAALIRSTTPGRRHLVAAFIEGIDYYSVNDGSRVLEIAQRADAVLHVALAPTYQGGYGRGRLMVPPSARSFVEAAEATGGAGHPFDRNVVAVFRDILSDYRASIVLRYAPEGVARSGWHQVRVRLNGAGRTKYTVRARQGYFWREG
jgi:VWFA-related protein